MAEKTLNICSFPASLQVGRTYSYYHDNLREDERCTNLGQRTAGSVVLAEEMKNIADSWAAKGATRVQYQDVFYYPRDTESDSTNTMVAVGAVVVILGGLYLLKKRRS